MSAFTYKNGVLCAEDVALPEIAAAVGTPVYVYSASRIRANYRALKTALPEVNICYAVKANSNQAVLGVLGKMGAGADIVSGGELQRALKAGIPPEQIVFSGVGKGDAEIRTALQACIHQINVESIAEIGQINTIASQLGRKAPIVLRVNPDVTGDTHHKISTGGKGDKFGIDHEQLLEAAAVAKSYDHIQLTGLACHIGSQLFDLEAYRRAYGVIAQYVAELRAAGHVITRLDLGGGMGVPYKGEVPFDTEGYGRMVTEVLGGLGCSLTIEPGRYIVADAGVLLSSVQLVKQGVAQNFVVIDAAMNDLVRPAMYDAWHGIRAVHQAPEGMPVDVVGPVCESSDCFASDRSLPPLQAGDLVVLETAGAYGAAMSSTYNTRALVPEVLVEGSRYAVVRPRIDAAAQIGWDKVPDWV